MLTHDLLTCAKAEPNMCQISMLRCDLDLDWTMHTDGNTDRHADGDEYSIVDKLQL